MKAMIAIAAGLGLATTGQAARSSTGPILPPPLESPPPLPTLSPVISGMMDGHEGVIFADVVLLNAGKLEPLPAPETLTATLHASGRDWSVIMTRRARATQIQPGQFYTVSYSFDKPVGAGGSAILSLGAGQDGYAFAMDGIGGEKHAAAMPEAVAPSEATVSPVVKVSANPPPPPRIGNGFLPNLSAYNPIYAVTGHGTDTNTRLQLSFKYQLLGSPNDGNWYSGFHLAYTQRMFWDTAANSAPFRDVNYQPEFLYFYTLPKNEAGDQLGVRGGFLHESNGRDGTASRSYNIVYLQPTLGVPIGGWTASIGPRIFHYVGSREGNEDIARYRGHQALAFSIAQPDGFKLSTWSRLNFSTGKGSVDADLSYPLTHIWHDLPLYVVVQGFTGYGEDLLDYDRKQTRLRVGIGIVR